MRVQVSSLGASFKSRGRSVFLGSFFPEKTAWGRMWRIVRVRCFRIYKVRWGEMDICRAPPLPLAPEMSSHPFKDQVCVCSTPISQVRKRHYASFSAFTSHARAKRELELRSLDSHRVLRHVNMRYRAHHTCIACRCTYASRYTFFQDYLFIYS